MILVLILILAVVYYIHMQLVGIPEYQEWYSTLSTDEASAEDEYQYSLYIASFEE